jgi:hypothetical protein
MELVTVSPNIPLFYLAVCTERLPINCNEMLPSNHWDFPYVLTGVKLLLKNLIKTNSVAYTELLVQRPTSANHREFFNCLKPNQAWLTILKATEKWQYIMCNPTCCTMF